jgi:hypothetical protein
MWNEKENINVHLLPIECIAEHGVDSALKWWFLSKFGSKDIKCGGCADKLSTI